MKEIGKRKKRILFQIIACFLAVACEKPMFETPLENRLITTNVTNIIGNGATAGGEIVMESNVNVLERGICWNTTKSPTVDDYKTLNGSGEGSFTSDITELNINTTYCVRAFAKCNDRFYYGNEVMFTTTDELYPDIKTRDITNITDTSAIGGGVILFWGNPKITSRGLCWSTIENPTVENYRTSETMEGGEYITFLKDLSPNTTYYVRAYAYCDKTDKYFYGEQKTFRTNG